MRETSRSGSSRERLGREVARRTFTRARGRVAAAGARGLLNVIRTLPASVIGIKNNPSVVSRRSQTRSRCHRRKALLRVKLARALGRCVVEHVPSAQSVRLVSARTEGPSTLSFLTHVASCSSACASNKEADASTRARTRTRPSAPWSAPVARRRDEKEISQWGVFDESDFESGVPVIFSDDRVVFSCFHTCFCIFDDFRPKCAILCDSELHLVFATPVRAVANDRY